MNMTVDPEFGNSYRPSNNDTHIGETFLYMRKAVPNYVVVNLITSDTNQVVSNATEKICSSKSKRDRLFSFLKPPGGNGEFLMMMRECPFKAVSDTF